ncbi:MAG: annexin [Chloroflexota bacterium]
MRTHAAPTGTSAAAKPAQAPGRASSAGASPLAVESGHLTPDAVAALQAAAGNRATVQALHAGAAVQRSLGAGQAAAIAARLHDAMAGIGTDEEAVYGALASRTPDDLDAIREAYYFKYDVTLLEEIRDEFSGDELARVMTLLEGTPQPGTDAAPDAQRAALDARARAIAQQLVEAMAGLGTEEDQIFNALEGRTPEEITAIKEAYHALTGRWVDRDFTDELSGEDLRRALSLVGINDSGTFDTSFTERMMEGFTAAGTGHWEWALEPGQLRVEVPIKFTPVDGAATPVGTWNQQIDDTWNQFAATEPGGRKVPINISMRNDPSGFHEVAVHPGGGRANTANWYVNQRTDVAPHEFGHLIGLPDEYMRSPEDLQAVAGVSVTGPANTSGEAPEQVARELHDAIYLETQSARVPACTALLNRVGLIVSGAAQQGAFAQSVKQAYDAEYSGWFSKDLVAAMHDRLPESDRWTVQTVFAVGTRSAMGGTGGLGAAQEHDHAVEPRHLRFFLSIVRNAWPDKAWTTGPK